MIIECPSCARRISSKYANCPHCGVSLSPDAPGATPEEVSRRREIQRRYRTEAQMYASILLTVAGAAWGFLQSDGLRQSPGLMPTTLFAAGALWYLLLRITMIVRRVRG